MREKSQRLQLQFIVEQRDISIITHELLSLSKDFLFSNFDEIHRSERDSIYLILKLNLINCRNQLSLVKRYT